MYDAQQLKIMNLYAAIYEMRYRLRMMKDFKENRNALKWYAEETDVLYEFINTFIEHNIASQPDTFNSDEWYHKANKFVINQKTESNEND